MEIHAHDENVIVNTSLHAISVVVERPSSPCISFAPAVHPKSYVRRDDYLPGA